MLNKWFPTKKEIEKWINRKLHTFAEKENRNMCLSKEEWLNRYMITNKIEIFFFSFPCEFHKWLSRLVDSQGTQKLNNPIVWTHELVKHLEASENNIMRVTNHSIHHILGGFITKFAINSSTSDSEAECRFFKGPRGKYLKSLQTWIKMLLCKKRQCL